MKQTRAILLGALLIMVLFSGCIGQDSPGTGGTDNTGGDTNNTGNTGGGDNTDNNSTGGDDEPGETVDLPPSVSMTAVETTGFAPFSAEFIAAAYDFNDDPLTYHWDFGDGNTSSEENPIHVFTLPGTYNVSVYVNDGHNDSEIQYIDITVQESPLEFVTDAAYTDEDGLYRVAGIIKNTGDQYVSYVTVSLTYYDAADQKVGTGSTSVLMPTLAPGATAPFKAVEYYIADIAYYTLEFMPGFIADDMGSSDSIVVVSDTGGYAVNNTLYNITGSVRNTGSTSAFVSIAAALYSASNDLVAVMDEWDAVQLPDILSPGATGAFAFSTNATVLPGGAHHYTLYVQGVL